MASEFERRLDRLEETLYVETRPLFRFFNLALPGAEEEHRAYLANTPESEQAMGSTPITRTLQKSLKMGQEECHGQTKDV